MTASIAPRFIVPPEKNSRHAGFDPVVSPSGGPISARPLAHVGPRRGVRKALVAGRDGSRMRGLKRRDEHFKSHPSRVCGLK
jgi:hypothetical protein